MANEGDRGGTNPAPGTHPRMSAGLPPGPGSTPRTEESGTLEKLSETAGQVRDKIRDVASGAAERLGEAWETTRQGVGEGARAVAHKAQDFWTDAGNLVRRNPMAAMAVAFGVGCLVGSALTASWGRREDDVIRGMSRSSA
jgi:ElaB/YqjD/DUF883 family membrane-anchored ribosome-binding protein